MAVQVSCRRVQIYYQRQSTCSDAYTMLVMQPNQAWAYLQTPSTFCQLPGREWAGIYGSAAVDLALFQPDEATIGRPAAGLRHSRHATLSITCQESSGSKAANSGGSTAGTCSRPAHLKKRPQCVRAPRVGAGSVGAGDQSIPRLPCVVRGSSKLSAKGLVQGSDRHAA